VSESDSNNVWPTLPSLVPWGPYVSAPPPLFGVAMPPTHGRRAQVTTDRLPPLDATPGMPPPPSNSSQHMVASTLGPAPRFTPPPRLKGRHHPHAVSPSPHRLPSDSSARKPSHHAFEQLIHVGDRPPPPSSFSCHYCHQVFPSMVRTADAPPPIKSCRT
jgi:hypothetical protein